jgi:hypothetical protein
MLWNSPWLSSPSTLRWLFIIFVSLSFCCTSLALFGAMTLGMKQWILHWLNSRGISTRFSDGHDLRALIRTLINRGIVRVPSLATLVFCSLVMIAASVVIPIQRNVRGQTVVRRNLYLPHVEQEMDQWHWWVEDSDPASKTYKQRTMMEFCSYGLRPPWDEGQTITWMRFQVEPGCLLLNGYDGLRDEQGKIINQ